MILMLLAPLIAVALVCMIPRGAPPGCRQSRQRVQGRILTAARYRIQRVKLSRDWWERFERDFAAYVDPDAVRARERERS